MSGPIDVAYVELRSDITRFERDVKTNVTRAMDAAVDAANVAGEGIQSAFNEAANQSTEELSRIKAAKVWDDITREAQDSGRKIETAMREAADAVDLVPPRDAGGRFVKLSDDAKESGRKIERAMRDAADGSSRHLAGIGGSLRTMATLAITAFAAIGVASFVRDSVTGAQEAAAGFAKLEQVVAATGQAAGLTAEQMASIATDLSFKIGVDDDEIIAAQTVLATFKNVSGDTFTTAIGLAADMSAVFGSDLSSSATQLGKALNDPVAGVSALTRVGIQFTDAQKEQIKAMVEAGDVAGAQAIILQEVEGQVAGAAEASATGAQRMAVAWGELKESLGGGIAGAIEGIAPAVTNLLTELGPSIETVGNNIGQFIGPLLDAFGPSLSVALDVVGQMLTDFGSILGSLAPIIAPIVQVVGVLVTALSGGLAAVFKALEPAIAAVGKFLDSFAETLGGVLFDAIEAITPALEIIGDVMSGVLAEVLPIINDLFDQLGPVLVQIGKVLSGVIAEVLPTIAEAFVTLLKAIAPLIPPLADGILAVFEAIAPVIPVIADALLMVVQALAPLLTALLPIIEPLTKLAVLLIERIGAPVLTILAGAIAALAQAFTALVTPIISMVTTVLEWLTQFIDYITGWVENIDLSLSSVVEFFTSLPGRIVDALASLVSFIGEAFTSFTSSALELVSGWVDGVVEFFTGLPGQAVDALSSIVENIVGVVGDMATGALDAVSGWIGDVVGLITGLPGKAVSALSNLASDILGSFTGMFDDVWNGVTGWIDDIVGLIGELPGKAVDAISGLATDVFNAFLSMLKDAVNSVIDTLNDFIPNDIGFDTPFGFVGADLPDNPIPNWNANGGIFSNPTVFPQGVGEAGKEAVIPVTRPGRAFELMQQSGLGAMWERMNATNGRGSEVGPLVSFPGAIIQDATDAEVVAQRVGVALMLAGG